MHRGNAAHTPAMGTTNYTNTFIAVAEDCPVAAAEVPPVPAKGPTVATMQFALLSENPYRFTSDDVVFGVYADRQGLEEHVREAARTEFFAKGQPCLRSSPMAKRYGWGFHHDAEGRVALVPVGSPEYEEFVTDDSLTVVKAMRSKRG